MTDKVNSLYLEQENGSMLSIHEDMHADNVVVVLNDEDITLDYGEADQLYAWLQKYINRAP